MKALFPVFTRPRTITRFYKLRPWEKPPPMRPRAIFIDVGVENPRTGSVDRNAVRGISLTEYFAFVRRFWNDTVLFIIPDNHNAEEHFKRLEASVPYVTRLRQVMRHALPIVVCHYCDDEAVLNKTLEWVRIIEDAWGSPVVVGIPGTIITSVRGRFKCAENVGKCVKFTSSLVMRLVDYGFSGRVHILGIRKKVFTFLHSSGLARHVLSADTDAVDLAPNEDARRGLRGCRGCFQVNSDPRFMDEWYLEWFRPYEPMLSVEDWLRRLNGLLAN
jgi:hypothetical protein